MISNSSSDKKEKGWIFLMNSLGGIMHYPSEQPQPEHGAQAAPPELVKRQDHAGHTESCHANYGRIPNSCVIHICTPPELRAILE
jgi:hypothetical protein